MLGPVIQSRRTQILEIARRHGARNIRIFGPCARGEAVRNRADSVMNAQPGVPRKRIAGMRDLLIQHDFGVKLASAGT
jgi:uncharacterized protein with HEPN domain